MAAESAHIPEPDHLFDTLKAYESPLTDVKAVAVAVSGGPDSLSLLWLLCQQKRYDFKIHALIIDHGLRTEAHEEARRVSKQVSAWGNVEAHILRWEGVKPDAAVQEAARTARYDLMEEYCKAHGIHHLFLGHHRDDLAETVLFRLAKGSGLDGLSGIRPVQAYSEHLVLLRPLLDCPKQALVELCDKNGIAFVHDPSNEKEEFARVRLRRSAEVLSEEGLSPKRLAVTAKRINRAREALEFYAEEAQKDCALEKKSKRIEYNFKKLQSYPEETVFRVVMAAFSHFNPQADYAPRMEKVEALVYDLISTEHFRKRTLGGVVFERNDTQDILILTQE